MLTPLLQLCYFSERRQKSHRPPTTTKTTMVDACYTVRATTREQVTAYIQKLDLPATNNNYQYDDAVNLVANARRVLTSIYNPTASDGSGMSKLRNADSAISDIKSTDIATINSIIKKSNAQAKQKIHSGLLSPPHNRHTAGRTG